MKLHFTPVFDEGKGKVFLEDLLLAVGYQLFIINLWVKILKQKKNWTEQKKLNNNKTIITGTTKRIYICPVHTSFHQKDIEPSTNNEISPCTFFIFPSLLYFFSFSFLCYIDFILFLFFFFNSLLLFFPIFFNFFLFEISHLSFNFASCLDFSSSILVSLIFCVLFFFCCCVQNKFCMKYHSIFYFSLEIELFKIFAFVEYRFSSRWKWGFDQLINVFFHLVLWWWSLRFFFIIKSL